MFSETIVAPITGLGRAAVAVVRVSGPRAWEVARAVCPSLPDPVVPRQAHYGRMITGDDGLVLPFAEGGSYTGEQTAELSVHGSPASVAGVLEACRRAGARDAGPGEFTMRAFLNGRLDLTQAEAVRGLVEAQTDRQLRQAARLRDGALSAVVQRLRDQVMGGLAAVEASTDFGEEVGPVDRALWRDRVREIRRTLATLMAEAERQRLVREGIRVALVGRPNAGKSSLLNYLLRTDRALVTDIPGTTRDTIEETLEMAGVPVRLTDTAGMRQAEDAVERLGIERSRRALAEADAVWHLYDLAAGWTPEDDGIAALVGARPYLVLATKADLAARPAREGALRVSVVTGEGVEGLVNWVAWLAGEEEADAVPLMPRHADLLRRADESLAEVERDLGLPMPDDLLAVGLGAAARVLGEVTGETTPPDVIERIFADFCIGK